MLECTEVLIIHLSLSLRCVHDFLKLKSFRRCEIPNPTPNIVGLGTRMIQEPFWLGLFAVFVVLGIIGLVWCGKRHFPEKIEKLLAEEADRCARRKLNPIFSGPLGGQIFRPQIGIQLDILHLVLPIHFL
jgi:hypothetical protein